MFYEKKIHDNWYKNKLNRDKTEATPSKGVFYIKRRI